MHIFLEWFNGLYPNLHDLKPRHDKSSLHQTGHLPVVNGGRTFHTVAQYNIVICDRDSFLFSRDIGELTFCVMDQIRLEY